MGIPSHGISPGIPDIAQVADQDRQLEVRATAGGAWGTRGPEVPPRGRGPRSETERSRGSRWRRSVARWPAVT